MTRFRTVLFSLGTRVWATCNTAVVLMLLQGFGSCSFDKQSGNADTRALEKTKHSHMLEEGMDLQACVYRGAAPSYLSDSCSFLFECDCCFADYYFYDQEHFYYVEPCEFGKSFTWGGYRLSADALVLRFSGEWVHKELSEASDYSEFVVTKSTSEAEQYHFVVSQCAGGLLLKEKANRLVLLNNKSLAASDFSEVEALLSGGLE